MCVCSCVRLKIEHTLTLQSTYQHLLLPDRRPEITTHHSRTAMTVDYIMYTPGTHTYTHVYADPDQSRNYFKVPPTPSLLSSFLKDMVTRAKGRGLHLLGRLSLVGQAELEEVSGLPNHHHSSDHLPLLARFRLWC